jgi:hypothetical protein
VSHIDPMLGPVATALVGHDVQVRCWSEGDWVTIRRARQAPSMVAFADTPHGRTELSPAICAPLLVFHSTGTERAIGSRGGWALSFAVVVLGHEAGHLRLGLNEAVAGCFGPRWRYRTARMLGADAGYAAALQAFYRERILPNRARQYQGCPARHSR